MRTFLSLFIILMSLSLTGCFGDGNAPSPPKETGSTAIDEVIFADNPDGSTPDTTFRASWDPSIGRLPYPNDLLGFLVNGSSDGTLNLPEVPLQPLVPQLNQLDGFSTNARIQANFSAPVAASSLTPASVFLVEVAVDPSTRAVVGLADETLIRLRSQQSPFLVQGEEYEVSLAPDFDAGGETIQLKPLKPLNEGARQTLPGNEGYFNAYMMILMGGENGIKSSGGTAAVADTTFEQIKQGYLAGAIQIPDDPSQIPPDLPTEDLLALFTAAQLAVSEALLTPAGLDVADVIATASFSTLNVSDVMNTVSQITTSQVSALQQLRTPVPLPLPDGTILPAGTPVTTALVLGFLGVDAGPIPGEGDVYAGTMEIPYYLAPAEDVNDTAILTEWWRGGTGVNPIDPESTVLSRFNPVPERQATVTVPVLVTIPNDNTAYAEAFGGTAMKPPEGWPVLIYNHGITRNRLDLFTSTEPLNDSGFALIAIDAPLHGIAVPELDFTLPPEELAAAIAENPTALLRIPGVPERTFDIDLVTGQGPSGGAPGTPDGVIDSSGAHYLNLVTPLVGRDNLRQTAADLISLTRTVPTMDLDGDGGADFDGSRIHFFGRSLGALTGTVYLASDSAAVTGQLAVGGGTISDLVLDSQDLGPFVEGAFVARGLVPNTGIYNNLFRDLQNIIDGGDPINFGAEAVVQHAILFTTVDGDTTVPNSSSARLAATMDITDVSSPGPNIDPAGWVARVCFVEGDHNSHLGSPASPAATVEMNTELVAFAAGVPPLTLPGDGQTVLIADPTVIGDFAAGDCQAPDRQRTNTQ
jgi:hypothetical protein